MRTEESFKGNNYIVTKGRARKTNYHIKYIHESGSAFPQESSHTVILMQKAEFTQSNYVEGLVFSTDWIQTLPFCFLIHKGNNLKNIQYSVLLHLFTNSPS